MIHLTSHSSHPSLHRRLPTLHFIGPWDKNLCIYPGNPGQDVCIAIIAIISAQERTLTPDRKWRKRQTHAETHRETETDTHTEVKGQGPANTWALIVITY